MRMCQGAHNSTNCELQAKYDSAYQVTTKLQVLQWTEIPYIVYVLFLLGGLESC